MAIDKVGGRSPSWNLLSSFNDQPRRHTGSLKNVSSEIRIDMFYYLENVAILIFLTFDLKLPKQLHKVTSGLYFSCTF